MKLIGPTGVFGALAIAFHTFVTRKELGDWSAEPTRRATARSIVFRAILSVMAHLAIDDDEDYQLLRANSMKQRFSIETLGRLIASNGEVEFNRLAITDKGGLRHVNRR